MLTILALAIIMQFGLPASTIQAEAVGVIVEGRVTKNGIPDGHNAIVARCSTNGGPEEFADVQFSNSQGYYKLHVNSDKCPIGSIMHLLHSYDLTNEKYDASLAVVTQPHIIADIEIGVFTYPVPEYGWAGGVVALVAATAAVLYIRTRRVNGTTARN